MAPPVAKAKPKVVAAPKPPAPVVVAEAVEPAPEPEPPKGPTYHISPESASLHAGDWGVQLILKADGEHGGERDLTSTVRWEPETDGIVTVEPSGYVRPLATGRVRVRALLDGEEIAGSEIYVTTLPPEQRPWNFATDIVPLLTRAGCNGGGCHGKADGQNGFHLSLFGYDPEGDYLALTREAGGRRIASLAPDDSLILRKATGAVPHGGGHRLDSDSDAYRTLAAWIAIGAPRYRGNTHGKVIEVAVEPEVLRLDEPGPAQLRVMAWFEDGDRRDVTRMSTFQVNDDSVAEIASNGQAKLLKRAETDLIVRFQSEVLSTRIATLINPDLEFDYAALPRRNLIDEHLFRRLESLKVPPSPPADDATFLRRVSLDMIGQQPQPEAVRRFMEDTDPNKRVKKVQELLDHRDFTTFWELKLGDMLQITSAKFPAGAGYYQMWLQEKLRNNTPWDQMVRELLTATGNPNQRGGGAVNYALDGEDAKVQAELTAQRFLGLRIRCAQCHDHPFDIWTQDDYYGLAAFFAKVQRGGGPNAMMGRMDVTINPDGQILHLRTKEPAQPKFLGGKVVEVPKEEDPRKTLAEWMTSPENPYFARAMANWVWAQFFGKGLADPADDLSAANPPVHPELLDALARHFVESGHDLRELIRTVASSEAYGLSSATVPGNEHDRRLFSHQMARPLTAHQMADALAQATDVVNRFQNRPAGTKAIDVFDPSTPSTILDTFGRCPRTNGCAAVSTPSLSLRQALLLIGGDVVDGKVTSLNGYLSNMLEYGAEPRDVVENLYFRTLCRPPTAEEQSYWTAELEAASSLREASEDLFWALLNSREFAFNH